jgi:hypothetical protein
MYTVGGREIEFVASEAVFLQIARICLDADGVAILIEIFKKSPQTFTYITT